MMMTNYGDDDCDDDDEDDNNYERLRRWSCACSDPALRFLDRPDASGSYVFGGLVLGRRWSSAILLQLERPRTEQRKRRRTLHADALGLQLEMERRAL